MEGKDSWQFPSGERRMLGKVSGAAISIWNRSKFSIVANAMSRCCRTASARTAAITRAARSFRKRRS